MRRGLTGKAVVPLIALVLIAGACSSTTKHVDKTSGSSATDAASGSTSIPGATASASAGSTSGSNAVVSGGTSPLASALATAPGAVVSKYLPSHAPGVTKDKIYVGVETLHDLSAVYAQFGVKGQTASDDTSRKIIQAMFDLTNSLGGFGGRLGVPIIHFTDITNGTHSSRAQVACSFFTEDHKVAEVIAIGNNSDALPRCLKAKSVPLIEDSNSLPYDAKDYAELSPYLYQPTKASISRFKVYIDGLAAQGFFSKGAKVGLARYDMPEQDRVTEQVIKPALAHYGVKLASEYKFTPVQAAGDLAHTASEASAAILRFKAAGVNHVIFLPTALVLDLVFPTVAQSQSYHPHYGINTADGPKFWVDNAPAEQIANTVGVGWAVGADLGSPRRPDNTQWKLCNGIIAKRALPSAAAYLCSPFFFLQEALRRAPEISPAGLRKGADALGRTAYSVTNMSTNWGPGRYDGAGAYRLLKYYSNCNCFRYSGPEVPF